MPSGLWLLFSRHSPLATSLAPRPGPRAENWVRFSGSIWPSFALSHNMFRINTSSKLASFGAFLSPPAPYLRIIWPLVTGHCTYSLATRHSPLATCHPPYPTPSSATRNWDHFACVICYEMLRFWAFSKIWETRFSTRDLNEKMVVASCLWALFSTTINANA